jgi:hypothetical protein
MFLTNKNFFHFLQLVSHQATQLYFLFFYCFIFRLNTSYKLDSKKVVDTCNVEELGKITFLKVIPGYCTQYRGLLSCAVPVVYNC